MIPFDEFKKIDIRIGKVISAEVVPDADKLIKLIFDLGDTQKQIIAGIRGAGGDAEELLGKEMPVVVNLEPRMLRGLESQGMILCAIDGETPVLLQPARDVSPGSIVR